MRTEADVPFGSEKPGIEIPGIDVITGLAYYCEDEDIFISILRSFVPNALSVIESMRNVSRETLPDYAIRAHGFKGISASIAAMKISNSANDLEKMAKQGDLAGVLDRNKAFIKDAEKLVSDVETWLHEYDKRNPRPLLPCPDMLLLTRLGECCETYDINEIDEILDTLESADYQKGAELVIQLREKINNLDFAAAVSRISEYIKEHE